MAVHHKDEVDPLTGKETKNGTSHIATDVMCDQVVELVRYMSRKREVTVSGLESLLTCY